MAQERVVAAENRIDAVRADGELVQIRPVAATDRAGLLALNRGASDRTIYLRFFATSRGAADRFVDLLLAPRHVARLALVALHEEKIVGVGSYEAVSPHDADVGLMVDDAYQHLGIGTLLLERLASVTDPTAALTDLRSGTPSR